MLWMCTPPPSSMRKRTSESESEERRRRSLKAWPLVPVRLTMPVPVPESTMLVASAMLPTVAPVAPPSLLRRLVPSASTLAGKHVALAEDASRRCSGCGRSCG
jgi:hypothetical protein